ncbi:hypothetical protein U1Q18_028523 [Sarracenia purpurea var. burkii]
MAQRCTSVSSVSVFMSVSACGWCLPLSSPRACFGAVALLVWSCGAGVPFSDLAYGLLLLPCTPGASQVMVSLCVAKDLGFAVKPWY